MRCIAIILLSAVAIASDWTSASAQDASCLERWPPDMATRPDFTCVPFTDRLLVSLQGATKAQLVKAMKANGRMLSRDEPNVLHFVGVADRGGDMNFEISHDRVIRIFGFADIGNGDTGEFVWNPAYHGSAPQPCSDLPGSQYARCND
jgi:hypothetical protein